MKVVLLLIILVMGCQSETQETVGNAIESESKDAPEAIETDIKAGDVDAAVIPDQTCTVPSNAPDGTLVCKLIVEGPPESMPTAFSNTATHELGDWEGAFMISNSGEISVLATRLVTVARSPILVKIMGIGGKPRHIFGEVIVTITPADE